MRQYPGAKNQFYAMGMVITSTTINGKPQPQWELIKGHSKSGQRMLHAEQQVIQEARKRLCDLRTKYSTDNVQVTSFDILQSCGSCCARCSCEFRHFLRHCNGSTGAPSGTIRSAITKNGSYAFPYVVEAFMSKKEIILCECWVSTSHELLVSRAQMSEADDHIRDCDENHDVNYNYGL